MLGCFETVSEPEVLPPVLSTERLTLRPLKLDDLDAAYAHYSHPEVGKWLFDGLEPERSKVEEELQKSWEMFHRIGLGIWGIALEGRKLVGTCGFLPLDDSDEIEILFSLDPELWGQGYAHEASLAVVDHAFLNVGLERIVGRCDVPNEASKRLLERLGMEFEKREDVHGLDTYHYALSIEDYLVGHG